MSGRLISISDFAKHIFWNYKKDSILDEDIVIQNIFLYGELDDFRKIVGLVSKESLANAVTELEKTGKYRKRVNFIRKVIL